MTPAATPDRARILLLHLGVLALLFALQFVLPAYHHASLSRILVLAVFAGGYNLAMGYGGMLSLGHAMFFGAGLYAAALGVRDLGLAPGAALTLGVAAGLALAAATGALALRTGAAAFMIVTLMLSQAFYLAILYFNRVTMGEEGFVLDAAARVLNLGALTFSLADPTVRYNVALALFAVCMLGSLLLVRGPAGLTLTAIRENEPRAALLGYNTFAWRLAALTLSGGMAAAAGGLYALLFGYAGASFAAFPYSVYPLLWVLVGGAGTVLGPLAGVALMFYLVDLSSGLTRGYLIVVGLVLVLMVLKFPAGLLGTLRDRRFRWLP